MRKKNSSKIIPTQSEDSSSWHLTESPSEQVALASKVLELWRKLPEKWRSTINSVAKVVLYLAASAFFTKALEYFQAFKPSDEYSALAVSNAINIILLILKNLATKSVI